MANFDAKISYRYEDVETGKVKYDEYIVSGALDTIATAWKAPRDEVADKLVDKYGGTLENAICNYVRNL